MYTILTCTADLGHCVPCTSVVGGAWPDLRERNAKAYFHVKQCQMCPECRMCSVFCHLCMSVEFEKRLMALRSRGWGGRRSSYFLLPCPPLFAQPMQSCFRRPWILSRNLQSSVRQSFPAFRSSYGIGSSHSRFISHSLCSRNLGLMMAGEHLPSTSNNFVMTDTSSCFLNESLDDSKEIAGPNESKIAFHYMPKTLVNSLLQTIFCLFASLLSEVECDSAHPSHYFFISEG